MLKKTLYFIFILSFVFAFSCADKTEKPETKSATEAQTTTTAEALPLRPVVLQELDVVYDEERDLKLDIYHPTEIKYENSPLIVAFHGGGWVSGDRSQILYIFAPIIKELRENGYAIATVQYSYAQDRPFPAQLQDCENAIKYLCENAEYYNIDINSIGVLGYSAGAQLAMLSSYATAENIKYCVSFAGPSKLYGEELYEYSGGIRYVLEWLFDGPYEKNEAAYMAGSPYFYLDHIDENANKAPLLLVHDERDDVVPFSQSQLMYEKAIETGISCELIKLSGVYHQIDFNFYGLENEAEAVLDFIYKYSG